jgi:hypothetical protein
MLVRGYHYQHDLSGLDIRERSNYERNREINEQERLSLIEDEDLASIPG